jgi:gamma-glutamyltranspeptidase
MNSVSGWKEYKNSASVIICTIENTGGPAYDALVAIQTAIKAAQ